MPFLRPGPFLFGSKPRGDASRRVLQDFVRALSVIVDPPQLHGVITAQLRETFGLDRVALALRDDDAGGYQLVDARSQPTDPAPPASAPLTWSEDSRLVRWLRVNEEPLTLDTNQGVVDYIGAEEADRLHAAGFRTVVPMVAMSRLTGFLFLGALLDTRTSRPVRRPKTRRAAAGLSPADLDLLAQLAGQAALACENAALIGAQRARLRRLYRAERLATAGELAAGAAHEIRNPLTSIRSTIQYLHDTLPDDHPGRPEASGLLEEVDRINEIVEGLLSFARPREAVFVPIDAADVVRQSVALVTSPARKQGVEIHTAVEETIPLIGDESLLKQLLLNLLLNAIQAMPERGEVVVSARAIPPGRGEPAERGGAFIEIADTGPGIPEELLEKVFDPFFTTKSGGTGLGLSICYGVAERHRGEIEIESRTAPGDGTGTTVRVRLRGGKP